MINKMSGEAMEGAGKGAKTGVVDLSASLGALLGKGKKMDGSDFGVTAVHRLDVPVTGCALFAREPDALAFLNTCFAEGTARKTYWAVTEVPDGYPAGEAVGPSSPGEWKELVHWLRFDPRTNKSHAWDTEIPDGKRSILRYRIVGRGERYLFVEVELITGRHHQIRAQLAAIGLKIKGDLKYGAHRSEKGGGIRLHARSLAIPDMDSPDHSRPRFIQCVAPVPQEDSLWAAFEAAAAKANG
ncbi:MAG TPA: RNA pseudouridine synthase [Treponema sp.]|nr:RNA pseudouridine synthase [Treponema sp.]